MIALRTIASFSDELVKIAEKKKKRNLIADTTRGGAIGGAVGAPIGWTLGRAMRGALPKIKHLGASSAIGALGGASLGLGAGIGIRRKQKQMAAKRKATMEAKKGK